MAETYKGLTIRIGGDTSGLQKSLRAVNSSIAQTEAQLRKMRTALRLDPGNTDAITKSLDLMGNKAIETQRRVLTLKRQIDQLGGEKVQLLGGKQSTETVRQLADLTEDASARAAEARKQYNAITEELAQFYRPINETVTATSKLDGAVDKATDSVRQFGKAWREAHNGKDFSTSDLIDEEGLESAIAQLRQLGIITEEQADKLRSLRERFGEAFDENQMAQAVSQIDKMTTDLIKAGAEAKNTTRQFSELSRAAMLSDFGKGIDDQLGHVESAARSVEAELKQLDDALRLDPHNVDLTAEKLRDLQEAASIAQSRADLLDQKLARLSSEGADKLASDMTDVRMEVERTAEAYDEVTAKVNRMEAAVRDLVSQQKATDTGTDEGQRSYQRLTDEIEEARNELRKLESAQEQAKAAFRDADMAQEFTEVRTEAKLARAEVNRYNDEVQQMGRFTGVTAGSLTSLGMSLSTSVTPTLIAAGWGIVESANDIDSAYRDMRKTVSGTEEDFKALRDAAIDFSTTHVTSAEQILSIQAIGGELGVATEDLNTFAETVSNINVATDLGTEDAATALGQLDNIMNDLSGDTMPNFADALVRLGNNGASTESQIIDIAKRIGSMGSIIGMSTPEVLAWSSAIASTGQNSEAAGTAISNTMSDIEQAVARGGDALQAFAETSGMSAEQFADTWNTNPTQALKAFIEGLNGIEANGGSASTTLGELGITATRQVQAIMGLMQTVGGLDDALEMSTNAWNGVSDQWGEAGDAAREAQAKADGFSGSLSRLQNMAQNAGAELGESLVPVIDFAADVLGDIFETFSEMPDSTKQAIVGVGAFVAALGPMILLGKGIGEFFGGVADGLTSVYTATKAAGQIKSLSGAFKVVETGASSLAGVLKGGLVAGGIALAIGGVAALVKAFQDEQREAELTERATKGLYEACSVAREGMTDAADATESYAEQIYDARNATDEMRQDLANLADSFDETNREASIDLDGLRRAEKAVADFDGQTDLTAQDVGEFKSAIEQLNGQCGTNYEVVRDAGGAYYVMEDGARAAKDEIYALIDAQREQVVAAAQNKKLEALYEEQYDALEKYNEVSADHTKALAELEDARQRYIDRFGVDPTEGISKGLGVGSEEANEWARASNAAQELNGQLSDQSELIDNLNSSIEKTQSSIGNLENAANGVYEGIEKIVMSKLNSTFDGDTDVMKDFAAALDDAGFSTQYLSDLSDTELVDLANAWKATGNDIEKAVEIAGLATTENFEKIRDSLRSVGGSTLTGFLSEMNMTIDQFATMLERGGVSAEQFSNVSSEAFSFMLENCGGDIDKLVFMIQNYNATPIADKQGNITVDTVQLYSAQGQIYTWNGTQLLDKNANIVVQKTEFEDVNGEVYTWNTSGDLVDKTGTVVIDGSQIELANGQIATYNAATQSLDANGTIYINDLELTDAYDNVVKLEGEKLVTTGVDGTVRVNYDDVTRAQRAVDNLMVNESATKTLNVVTRYTTIGSASKASGFTPQDRSAAPQSQAATMSSKVASAVSATRTAASVASAMDGVSLMSDESAKLARAVSAAPRAASAAASSLVGSMVSSLPGNRRSIRDANDLAGEVVNNYYDVTVDGNGTTERVEGIVLELLDALEQLGKV